MSCSLRVSQGRTGRAQPSFQPCPPPGALLPSQQLPCPHQSDPGPQGKPEASPPTLLLPRFPGPPSRVTGSLCPRGRPTTPVSRSLLVEPDNLQGHRLAFSHGVS